MKSLIKQLLRENLSSCNVFADTTGLPYYDGVFENPLYHFIEKRIKGSVIQMSPDEYMETCARMFNISQTEQSRNILLDNAKSLLKKMKEGIKINMPHIHISQKAQEGRHRSIAAKMYGCDLIPVAVFQTVTNEEAEEMIMKLGPLEFEEMKAEFESMGLGTLDSLGYRSLKGRYQYMK